MKKRQFIIKEKQVIKEKEKPVVAPVVEKFDIQEVTSMAKANELIGNGYETVEVKSAQTGIRSKTWVLKKEK